MNALQPAANVKNQIIIQANCLSTPVNLLIDTGASLSLVNTRFINQIDVMHKIMPTSYLIAGLGKTLIPLRGEIKLPITLGSTHTTHIFAVCDNVDNEFLVGTDLLRKLEVKIDFPSKKVYTPYGEEKFLIKPVSINSRMKIRCNKTITLAANTTGYLFGKIPIKNTTANYEGVIEPYHKLADDKGIFITGSLAYSDKNLVPIHYVNVLSHDVTIYRNQLVAFLEPFEKIESVQGVHQIRSQNHFYNAEIDVPRRLPTADSVETTKAAGKWENPAELHKQLSIDEIDISPDQKQQLKDLVTEYSHCFSRNRFDLGKASFYKAKINLKRDYVAKWVPSRPVSYKLEPYMDEEIDNMIKTDQITKCPYSLWNSAVFLVGKPNVKGGSKYRFVQDGRALNSQCIQDNYELPKINNILDKMSECNYLSSFDFTSSFTQIGLENASQPLTAFTYKGSHFMWKRLMSGQTSSSAQFSRCMAQLFSKVPF